MASDAALAELPAEINCPVCLDNLKDPVTIECGHNFCRFCIQQSWADLQDRFPCPVCCHSCQERDLRSNTQLEKMADTAKAPQTTRGKKKQQGETPLCEKHNRALTLFCEEDLELLCHLCTQPPDHQGHQVRPVAEAASHYRQKLRGYAEVLKKQLADTQKSLSIPNKTCSELRKQVETKKLELRSESELPRQFLECEREVVFSRLADKEKEIEKKLRANITEFSEYNSTVKGLRSQIADCRVLTDAELLLQVKSFNKNSQAPPPAMFSNQLWKEGFSFPFQHSALQRITKTFRVDIILDPETAHPNLTVSEDKKSVQYTERRQDVLDSPKRFIVNTAVLGFPYFHSGRHFWEVEVGDKTNWGIGVCKDSLSTRLRSPAAAQGCWQIRRHGNDYDATGASPLPRLSELKPRDIGVFLDYEMGELSFYNMADKSHIFTFDVIFNEPLRPYFYVGHDSEPLRISIGTD
ncbi:tripartite motif-containing protein 75-like [Myotis yumanensis]|uniref:tripartite motif-containing protein 75-like n=1 Tax=Myotis yumanensis TaxID=159337 RepID=UPI0038D4D08C